MESPKKTIDGTRTFFRTLFDFSFSKFITVQMFPALYGIILAASLVGIFYYTFEAFMESLWKGLFYLMVAGPVAFIAIAAVTRALMELYIVIFRMAENVDEIYLMTQKFSGFSNTVDGMRDLTRKLPIWNLVNSGKAEDKKMPPARGEDKKDNKEKSPEKEKPRKPKDVNWPY